MIIFYPVTYFMNGRWDAEKALELKPWTNLESIP
jgi:hypothetical protein